MKTNFLKKAMSVCMLVCTMSFVAPVNNANSQTLKSKYYYDSSRDEANPTRMICVPDESGKYLVPHLKYYFTYNENGQVATKEVHKWNKASKSWEQKYIMNIAYEESAITMDYAAWDGNKAMYAINKEKAVYNLENGDVISYACYKQENNNEEWMLVAETPEIQKDYLLIADMPELQQNQLLLLIKERLLAENQTK